MRSTVGVDMSDDFGVCITNRPRVPLVTHRLVEVALTDTVADGRAPSNHTAKPSRAILIGDKVASGTHQGDGVVVAYHDGLLVVSWPPQYHDTDDVWLSERAPENVAKHEEMMR